MTDVGASCQLTTAMADAAVQVKRGARAARCGADRTSLHAAAVCKPACMFRCVPANKVTAPAMFYSPCAWEMTRLPALPTDAFTHRIIT